MPYSQLANVPAFVDPYFFQAVAESCLSARFTAAHGSWLTDEFGKRYLDVSCGYGAAHLGHNHPEILNAISTALEGGTVLLPPFGLSLDVGKLASTLCELANRNLNKVLFCASGSEAVETARNIAASVTGRRRSIQLEGGYHGHFLAQDSEHGVCTDINHLAQELQSGKISAVIVELIQGSNGARIIHESDISIISNTCEETGTLFIIDEVLTGLGRTGRWFEFHNLPVSVQPDIVICSKALTGGCLPVSAILMTDAVYESAADDMGLARYRSTLSANTLGIRTAIAAIQIMQQDQLLENVVERGEQLKCALNTFRNQNLGITDVCGKGLLLAIKIEGNKLEADIPQAFKFLQALFRRSVVASASMKAPDYVTLTPPVNVSQAEISFLLEALREGLLELDI